jgi:hypothetical protein
MPSPANAEVLLTSLTHRWQRKQASGARDSTSSTDKRRERGFLPSSDAILRRSPALPGGSRRRSAA